MPVVLCFESLLTRLFKSGVDVQIFFYDLHDGWDFLHSIKEGAYDCIASFEVDPYVAGLQFPHTIYLLTSYLTRCALAQGFHFMDEPNLMFSGILAVD